MVTITPALQGLSLQRPAGKSRNPFAQERFHFDHDSPVAQNNPVNEEKGNSPASSPLNDSLQLKSADLSYLKISMQFHLEEKAKGSVESVLEKVRGLTITIEQLHMKYRSSENGDAVDQSDAPQGTEANPFLAKLLDYFNPEKTAKRIADFVIKGFSRTSFGAEDAPESRRKFIDFISPFIRSGVDSALSAFGDSLPDEIRGNAESTFAKVGKLLESFAGGSETKEGSKA